MRPGIVHRLDKDTSGLMVVAKTDRAHRGLAAQFADHGRTGPLERGYMALAWGAPARAEGTIDAPLGRSTRNREKIEVKREGGREAITHYRVAERYGAEGQAAGRLAGRMPARDRPHPPDPRPSRRDRPSGDRRPDLWRRLRHQGRRSCPSRPGRSPPAFPRQALHAYLLGFEHPVSHEEMRFESPLPADIAALVEALKSL